MAEFRERESWRIDKKISLILVFSFLVQAAGLFVWGGRVEASIGDIYKRQEKIDIKVESLDNKQNLTTIDVCQRLSRVEEKISNVGESAQRIETLVRNHMERNSR